MKQFSKFQPKSLFNRYCFTNSIKSMHFSCIYLKVIQFKDCRIRRLKMMEILRRILRLYGLQRLQKRKSPAVGGAFLLSYHFDEITQTCWRCSKSSTIFSLFFACKQGNLQGISQTNTLKTPKFLLPCSIKP